MYIIIRIIEQIRYCYFISASHGGAWGWIQVYVVMTLV